MDHSAGASSEHLEARSELLLVTSLELAAAKGTVGKLSISAFRWRRQREPSEVSPASSTRMHHFAKLHLVTFGVGKPVLYVGHELGVRQSGRGRPRSSRTIYAIYAFARPYLARTGMRSEPSLGYTRGYSGPSRSDVQLMHDVQ